MTVQTPFSFPNRLSLRQSYRLSYHFLFVFRSSLERGPAPLPPPSLPMPPSVGWPLFLLPPSLQIYYSSCSLVGTQYSRLYRGMVGRLLDLDRLLVPNIHLHMEVLFGRRSTKPIHSPPPHALYAQWYPTYSVCMPCHASLQCNGRGFLLPPSFLYISISSSISCMQRALINGCVRSVGEWREGTENLSSKLCACH